MLSSICPATLSHPDDTVLCGVPHSFTLTIHDFHLVFQSGLIEKHISFSPLHSDCNCECIFCRLFSLVKDYEKNGYFLTDITSSLQLAPQE